MSPRAALRDTFRSLRVRNYRLFTTAQLVSLSGTWMQTVAQSWLVLRLTGSGVALGVVTALQFVPTAIAGIWGGVIADRFDRRKILLATQSLSGLVAGILAVLTATGVVELWMVYVLAFSLGLVTAIDTPARQAFVMEMVGSKQLANAVGLNSAVFNTARIIGPALAAIVIAAFGIASAFLLNALSYLGPVIALTRIDPSALHRSATGERTHGMLREGFRFVWRTRVIRRTLLVLAVVSTIAFNFAITLPLLARFTFDAGVGSFALLTSLTAGGGLMGALWVARRARPTQRLLAGATLTFGVFMLATAFAPTIAVAGTLLVATGAASMAMIATANSTLQLSSPPRLRGRVMAVYALVFLGSTPIGGPIVGWIGEHWGARTALGVGAVASIVAALVALATLPDREPSLAAAADAPSPIDRPGSLEIPEEQSADERSA